MNGLMPGQLINGLYVCIEKEQKRGTRSTTVDIFLNSHPLKGMSFMVKIYGQVLLT